MLSSDDFANLIAMKIKILVISLLRSPDRREVISSRLNGLGLDFAFVDAVDARALSTESVREIQLAQRTHRDYGRLMGPTEISCAMSHVAAYREIANSKLDGAIILEDDAIIDNRFRALFNWLQAQRPSLRGLFLLGGGEYLEKGVVKNYFDFAILAKTPELSDPSWGAFFRVDRCFDRLARACGYFIDQESAARLFENNSPPKALADDWPFFIRQGWITPYLCRPYLIEHPLLISGQSLLQEDRSTVAEKTKSKKTSTRLKELTGYYRLIYRLKVLVHQWKSRAN